MTQLCLCNTVQIPSRRFSRWSKEGNSLSRAKKGRKEARTEFSVTNSCRDSALQDHHVSQVKQEEKGEEERKWKTWSVSTGQIRQARGLASEDLIGLTLAADLLQLSLEGRKKRCQQETGGWGTSLAFSKNLSLCGWMTSPWSSSSSLGVEGAREVLSIICNVAVTLFHRPVSLVA